MRLSSCRRLPNCLHETCAQETIVVVFITGTTCSKLAPGTEYRYHDSLHARLIEGMGTWYEERRLSVTYNIL